LQGFVFAHLLPSAAWMGTPHFSAVFRTGAGSRAPQFRQRSACDWLLSTDDGDFVFFVARLDVRLPGLKEVREHPHGYLALDVASERGLNSDGSVNSCVARFAWH
jgi:hypothetical protein